MVFLIYKIFINLGASEVASVLDIAISQSVSQAGRESVSRGWEDISSGLSCRGTSPLHLSSSGSASSYVSFKEIPFLSCE